MSVTFWKGKQITWFPEKKDQIIRIPYQKNTKPKDQIIFDQVLRKDQEFGQPYLQIKLVGEVIRNGQNKKIFGMKYKPKKRTKRAWGHREKYTEVKILSIEE